MKSQIIILRERCIITGMEILVLFYNTDRSVLVTINTGTNTTLEVQVKHDQHRAHRRKEPTATTVTLSYDNNASMAHDWLTRTTKTQELAWPKPIEERCVTKL